MNLELGLADDTCFWLIIKPVLFTFAVEAEWGSVSRQRAKHKALTANVLFVLCPLRPLLLQGLRG